MRFVLALVALTVAVAGCSGDDASSDDAPATDIEVRMDSFLFDPANVTVLADADISVTALNLDSALQHNWVVIEQGAEIDDERDLDESTFLFETTEVDPQTSATGTFRVAAGEYQILCTIPGHFSAGMVGTLAAVAGS